MRFGIIGTAGRKQDGRRMNISLFEKMCTRTSDLILKRATGSNITLVSGGAAWADHVAVKLFLDHDEFRQAKLELHLPAEWDDRNICFKVGDGDRYKDPGSVANYYHSKMISHTIMSLSHLNEAILATEDCTVRSYDGFFERNLEVGKVDCLIAMTWGYGNRPKDSGTGHTWRHSPAPEKIHIPLASL